MEHSIGLTIRTLSNLLKRRMFETHPSPGGPPPTKMHAEIIDFLYQNRESVIFQRDLEAHFSIRRSTASGLLRLMEERGIVYRESVADELAGAYRAAFGRAMIASRRSFSRMYLRISEGPLPASPVKRGEPL